MRRSKKPPATKTRARTLPKSSFKIYKLKVTLERIAPPIWRRVLVPSDATFADLHRVIQESMGWLDYHLHVFRIGDRHIGMRHEDSDDEDGRKVSLDSVVDKRGTVFSYEYDFGDGWDHLIKLEEVLDPDPRVTYPICIAGARACPPEDSGGPGGYQDLLEILASPKHPEHDDRLSWLGGLYDPEGFDVNRVNAALRPQR